MKEVSLFVYDFDGTLVDTLQDITQSINLTLKDLGLQPLPAEKVRSCVGSGVVMLLTRALSGTGFTEIEKAVDLFRKHYAAHLMDQTDFYPNCRETVEFFSGKTHAIISNKPTGFIIRILAELDFLDPFHTIFGGDSLKNKKPDPEGLHHLMEEFDLPPDRVVMVGDSDIDIETGRRAGVLTCGVTWGMGDRAALEAARPRFMIHNPADLKTLFR